MFWRNEGLLDTAAGILNDDGWPMGTGIFETIKTVHGIPYAFSRHMRRALKSARILSIPMPSEETIRNAIETLLAINSIENGRLRLSFSHGGEFIATHESYSELSEPIKIKTIPHTSSLVSDGHKRFPYVHRLDLLGSVREEGFGEVISIDDLGNAIEGAISNFAVLQDGRWVTPPISSGALPGVMRALAIEKLGMKVSLISSDDLRNVDGAVLLSSLKIAHPVSSIDSLKFESLENAEAFAQEMRSLVTEISVG